MPKKDEEFSLSTVLKEQMAKIDPTDPKKRLYAEIFVEKLIQKAIKDSNSQSYKLIFSYVDGLPKQSIEVDTGDNINNILKKLHGIDSGKQETPSEQGVEDEPSVQDYQQEGGVGDVQAEQSPIEIFVGQETEEDSLKG